MNYYKVLVAWDDGSQGKDWIVVQAKDESGARKEAVARAKLLHEWGDAKNFRAVKVEEA